MMPVKICSGVATAWANYCCDGACTFRDATRTWAHRQWIDGLAWAHDAKRAVVDDYLLAIDQTEARLQEARCPTGRDCRTRVLSGSRSGWVRDVSPALLRRRRS